MNKRQFLKTGGALAALGLASGCSMMPDSMHFRMPRLGRIFSSGPGDILDVAAGAGTFGTLVSAIGAAGLSETLRGEGPFTVFAPLDSAFNALPVGVVENLLIPENKDELVALLSYHVIPGRVPASELAGTRIDVATLQGTTVLINGTEGLRVNDARVETPDIEASNGLIHAIDTVLMPA